MFTFPKGQLFVYISVGLTVHTASVYLDVLMVDVKFRLNVPVMRDIMECSVINVSIL